MIKKLFLTTQLLFCCFVLHSYARNEYASDSDRDLKRRNKMVKEAALLPDSAFEYVKMEDLLDDLPSNGYPLTVSCRAEIRSTSSWIQPITR